MITGNNSLSLKKKDLLNQKTLALGFKKTVFAPWTVNSTWDYEIIKAIQEQQVIINEQQSTIEGLRARIEALEAVS